MRIDIVYRAPWRMWQTRLADELARMGHAVKPVLDPAPSDIPRKVRMALRTQQFAFGPRPALFDPEPLPVRAPEGAADLVMALDGALSPGPDVLEPLFAGVAGEGALLAAVATGCAVPLVIRRRDGIVTEALCANEHADVVSRGLDQVLKRVVTLLAQAAAREPTVRGGAKHRAPRNSVTPLASMTRGLFEKLKRRLQPDHSSPNHWRVAYRIEPGSGLAQELRWPSPFFHILTGASDRFYADPIPVEHEGRRWIFFEDYPYALKKGVIGVVEIMPDGSAGVPRTVLDHDVHLSYPFVIRHHDAIYMLPEMGGARRVQLFRADRFPDAWVPDRILIDDVVASDTTPIFHEGRWWMFMTLADDGGSTWDSLCLFHAPNLFGPWQAHVDNPVLVDAGAARPAGPMWHEGGALMRIVQDCRDGYGRGLAICRVDRLDESAYAQTVVSRLGTPNLPGADGAHTLAKDGSLEVVDIRFTRPGPLRAAPERD